MTYPPRVTDIGAVYRCDGTGEPAADGNYVLVAIGHKGGTESEMVRIPIMVANLLVDDLQRCLGASTGTDVVVGALAAAMMAPKRRRKGVNDG